LFCSFCGKSNVQVKKLIAGPAVHVCDECVALCTKIIAETPDPDPATRPARIEWPADLPTDNLLSLLKAKVGYPWTTLPDMMMAHAAAGYGGHGTLCGALGGASTIINIVTYTGKRDEQQNNQMIDRLFWWYADQNFPSNRFDDLSPMPKQIKVKAMSPLCHTSVSKWAVAAGATIKSDAKIERCAKVAGEVAYTVADALNDYFDGRWTPPVWKPSSESEHCVGCHGPDTSKHKAREWNQQGHLECPMCHDDHTKHMDKVMGK